MTQASDGARQTGGESFRVRRALSHTFIVYKRGFGKFTLLAWTYLAPLMLVEIAADFLLTPRPLNLVYDFAPWVLLPAWIIGHGACVIGAVALLDGESSEGGRSFWLVARRFRPLLGLGLFIVVAGALGVLYFTPAVIVFLIFVVGGAVRTAEDMSLIDSFRRTLELTKDRRVAVLSVYLVFLLMTAIFVVLSGFVMVVAAVKIGERAGVEGLPDAIVAVGQFACFSVVYAIGAVLIGVVYRDLRVAGEMSAMGS